MCICILPIIPRNRLGFCGFIVKVRTPPVEDIGYPEGCLKILADIQRVFENIGGYPGGVGALYKNISGYPGGFDKNIRKKYAR